MTQPAQLLKEVIGTQYFAVLNTFGDSLPYSNLVAFAISDDFRTLVFITNRNTRKYKNIQENHNISFLIDNRTNQPFDISQAIAITVIGTAYEVRDKKNKFKDIYLSRHPQLRQFVDNPNNAMLLIAVREYIIADFHTTWHLAIS